MKSQITRGIFPHNHTLSSTEDRLPSFSKAALAAPSDAAADCRETSVRKPKGVTRLKLEIL